MVGEYISYKHAIWIERQLKVRTRSDRASAAAAASSLASKIQMDPRAIQSIITSDATTAWYE